MNASLEPPSLRRRDKVAKAPKTEQEPKPPKPRRRPPFAAIAVVILILTAVVGVGLFAYSMFHDTSGQHEDTRVPPSTATSAPPVVQLPPADYDAVETAARSALSAWARPTAHYRAWWRVLEPLLSPSARADYAGTDPSQLPDLTLSPQVDVTPGPSQDTATVYLGTSAGRFGVDLTREGQKSPWLVERFLFPGQDSSLS